MAGRKPAAKAPQTSINKAWHRAHRMPARATTAQRLRWHQAHAKACGCRPMPASLQRMATKGAAPPKRMATARSAAVNPKAEPKRQRGGTGTLARLRAICLALPNTAEVEAWGHPTFRVAGKIFATFGNSGDGDASTSVKTSHEMQAALVSSDPRFTVAAYVGKHGWVSLALPAGKTIDWNEIDALVRGSYRLVAPAKLAATVSAP